MPLQVNINKAKELVHDRRRQARSTEFAPYDEIIAKQIPFEAEKAEAARQAIREKYAVMQQEIDDADDVDVIDAKAMELLKTRNPKP